MSEIITQDPTAESADETVILTPIEEVQRSNRFSRFVVQPVLIGMMVASLAGAFLSILHAASGRLPWLWMFLPILIFSFEGVYTTIWLTRPDQRLLNKTLYRAAEVLTILITVRVYSWALTNSWPTFDDLETYLRTPSEIFADPFFLAQPPFCLCRGGGDWSWRKRFSTWR